MSEEIQFPVYRKYVGIDVWFEISSKDHFIEYKKVGSKMMKTEVKAVQFPEKLMIQDMIECKDGRWEVVDSIRQ